MAKAIEVEYNGNKFHSKLEARWAVFFDNAGIKYEYEKERYEVDGNKYLPNFYLPELDTHVVVKENTLDSIYYMNECKNMIVWGGPVKAIVVLSDIPRVGKIPGIWHFPVIYYDSSSLDGINTGWFFFRNVNPFHGEDKATGCISGADYKSIDLFSSLIERMDEFEKYGKIEGFDISPKWENQLIRTHHFPNFREETETEIDIYYEGNKLIFDSFEKARQARFEYGEKPKVS